MKSNRTVLVTLGVALGAGVVFGLLSSFAAANGGEPMSALRIAAMSGALGAIAGAISHNLAGNRAQATAGDAEQAHAKRFAAIPDRAVVHVFRDGFYGKLVGLELALDSMPIGQVKGGTFFRLELAPGRHVLTGMNPQDRSSCELAIDAKAGEVRFVEYAFSMGLKAQRVAFNPIAESDGRRRVARCRLLVPVMPTTVAV